MSLDVRGAEAGVDRLADLLSGHRCVVLSGAGCSTESGIPDYRGAGRPARASSPILHGQFMETADVRRRYWARATVGWVRFSAARPNPAHLALAELERAGVVTGIITQNVDRLHQSAGSQRVVELHGALADVVCLECGTLELRMALQERLLSANPGWLKIAADLSPDGDADLPGSVESRFRVVGCCSCGGVLKPDIVFFGGTVAPSTLAAAWRLFCEAEVLLVVGSSLAVYSGFRFVRRAAEVGLPVAVVNLGATRADVFPVHTRLEARLGEVLPRLLAELRASGAVTRMVW
jgi:NAD-dependent deacetylase sirtuin 4